MKSRKVPGFGGQYKVRDDGTVWRDGFRLSAVSGKYVSLSWEGHVSKVKIAYLVARAFVPNSECREFVRHKNGDLCDNRAENLEWSDRKEDKRGKRAVGGPVSVFLLENGVLVGSWPSLKEASMAVGVSVSSARRVLRGAAKSIHGYVFKQ